MKYVVCSVRDRAADAFGAPFYVASVGQALRSFTDAVNNTSDASNVMATHPEDFDLFHLGFFHDQHAQFELLDHPVQLAVGKDIMLKPHQLSSVARAVSA